MSESMPEDQGPSMPMQDGPSAAQAIDLARYTIHVPVYDNNKSEIPHVLAALRAALTQQGFPGRTVIRKAQGDWDGDETSYDTEEMDLVMIDAPDDPETLNGIIIAAQGVKELAQQENVYVTVQKLTTYLV